MPEGRDDIEFGFNPEPFVNGFKKMNQSMAQTEKNTENLVKKVSQGMMSAVMKVGALTAGFLGVKAIMARIPEVGMVFKQAGDIFFKNLLWPLRKELMPILQGILNWVRDNRERFVIWGQTIANIFRVIVTIGKEIFEIARTVGKAFMDFINNVFGSQIKTFDEMLNVLTFKFALVAEFVGGILKKILTSPFFQTVVEFLGKMVGLLAKIGGDVLGPLFEGLTKSSLKDANTPLKSITDNIIRLMDIIEKFTASPIVKGFTKMIGTLFGDSVQLILTNVSSVIEALTDSIQWLVFGIQALSEAAKGTPWDKIGQMATDIAKAQGKRWEAIGQNYVNIGKNAVGAVGDFVNNLIGGKKPETAHDALVTKAGQIIKFDPEDSIMASKGGMGKTVKVEFGSINLNVTEGNARQAGENYASGVYDQIRSKLNFEFTGTGG